MGEIQIEQFDRAKHDRSEFQCGQPSLDAFIRLHVSQYESRRLGRTFVAINPSNVRVLGYYTLASGAIAFENLPQTGSKKLPKHPVPTILIGRLAVDRSAQGLGLGRTLLMSAITKSVKLAQSLGVYAIEVHAIDSTAAKFYAKYGFSELSDDKYHLFLPLATATQLPNVTD